MKTPGVPTFDCWAEDRFFYPVPQEGGTRTEGCHLVFQCPSCGKVNRHGGTYGKPGDGDGHRVAHCNCWDRGYYLREVPGKHPKWSKRKKDFPNAKERPWNF